ncbi:DUF5995 family protein [Streptomyces sp. NPDC002588]|uniref:DUF5995 family protein n=1 Tax=Streptomyces sp. NPDC002588 TaxID=3154419 RepID=UPI0033164EC5
MTVEVRTAIHGGLFDDGARMDRFDTLFGNRYFDAYDAWRRDRSGPRWRRGTTPSCSPARTRRSARPPSSGSTSGPPCSPG